MADRMLMVSWGTTVRGREERALEVFNESIGYYGRAVEEGRLESFDACLLDPSHLAGFATLPRRPRRGCRRGRAGRT